MNNLIKSEIYKLKYDKNMYFISIAVIILGIISVAFKSFESGYYSFTSQFRDMVGIFACSVYASMSIGMEFNNRTMSKKVIIGYSRSSIVLSKLFSFIVASFIILTINLVSMTGIYSLIYGWGVEFNLLVTISSFMTQSLINICVCMIAFFISFIIKESGKSTATIILIMALIVFISQNPWLVIFNTQNIGIILMVVLSSLVVGIIFTILTCRSFSRCELK